MHTKMTSLRNAIYNTLLLLLAIFALLTAGYMPAAVILSDGSFSDTIPEFFPKHANEGAFEGGPSGTRKDAGINLAVTEERQRRDPDSFEFNIPTGANASPLFGALEFTQRMFRFEEFGPEAMPAEADIVNAGSLPRPPNHQSGPNPIALANFLDTEIYPYPTHQANDTDLNPWRVDIESFLGRSLQNPPAEGRPPGELWSHQRWQEFFPQTYFQTAQAPAADNTGFRDKKQRHRYELGEFGPGGLYHNTTGRPGYDGTTKGIDICFAEEGMPDQLANSVFTFDGTFPPKLLQVRYGEAVLMRHYNALPIDPAANNGFGLHTITTHEHNGHVPAESDGYTQAFFFPGQFFDYRWPIQLAGYDSINIQAADPRAGMPDGKGGIFNIRGDYRETMSTHWFHDHMLDFTAQNVYKGNAAMMNYYSSIDRGNEEINDGVNLRFPSGTSLDWGNRDYDVNLAIADKAWDSEGQLFFNIFNTNGFLGDRILTNWIYNPYFEVRARRYRFRILNAAVSRYFKFALVTETGEPVAFHMILNDGNIMQHAVAFPDGILPTLGIAERYDIIVDFSRYAPGTKIHMVNLMEHKNGRGPEKDPIPLNDVLSGTYKPVVINGLWRGGDPGIGKFLEFQVVAYADVDQSMDPVHFVAGKQKMTDLPTFSDLELSNAKHRTFEFGRSSGTDGKPWTIKTDGGQGLGMDPRRLSAAPVKNGDSEIWHIINGGGGWSHPIHIHFEEGKILSRDGQAPPEWEQYARKDIYRLGKEIDSSQEIEVALRFREFAGTYMEHCHNTQHEDTAMLLRWDIENPGQTIVLPTPMPTWDGVTYVDSHALPTFRTGRLDPILENDDDDNNQNDNEGITLPPMEIAASGIVDERGRIKIRGFCSSIAAEASAPFLTCRTDSRKGRFTCRGRNLEAFSFVQVTCTDEMMTSIAQTSEPVAESPPIPTSTAPVIKTQPNAISEPTMPTTDRLVVADARGRLRFDGTCPSDTIDILSSTADVRCTIRNRKKTSLKSFRCRGTRLTPGLQIKISCIN